MYIVNIYEEDYSDTHGKILIYVGKLKGRFLTQHDAQIKIDNQEAIFFEDELNNIGMTRILKQLENNLY